MAVTISEKEVGAKNLWSKRYDSISKLLDCLIKKGFLKKEHFKKVIDVSCGWGTSTYALALYAFKKGVKSDILGVDEYKDNIENVDFIRKEALGGSKLNNVKINFKSYDSSKGVSKIFMQLTGKYAMIACFSSIVSVNVENLWINSKEHLKKGGIFIYTTIVMDAYNNFIDYLNRNKINYSALTLDETKKLKLHGWDNWVIIIRK